MSSAAAETPAADAPPRYEPGMDERSTRVAEKLATPMLVAAALVLPSVVLSESHTDGVLRAIAIALNWITYGPSCSSSS